MIAVSSLRPSVGKRIEVASLVDQTVYVYDGRFRHGLQTSTRQFPTVGPPVCSMFSLELIIKTRKEDEGLYVVGWLYLAEPARRSRRRWKRRRRKSRISLRMKRWSRDHRRMNSRGPESGEENPSIKKGKKIRK